LQATFSNYSRVHGGNIPPYLDCFTKSPRAAVIVDELQSEQGSRFFRKQNRTMVVEAPPDLAGELSEDFAWVSLDAVLELLHADNTVNMNARSVLASLWARCILHSESVEPRVPSEFGAAVSASAMAPLEEGEHTISDLEFWLDSMRRGIDTHAVLVPLRDVRDWEYDGATISHRSGGHFSVIGVDVAAPGREVGEWQQPLLSSAETGMNALVCQVRDGLLHVLIRAQDEPGTVNGVELAPTVQCTPSDSAGESSESRLYDLVLRVGKKHIVYDRLLSEEGGRFYHDENRYRIVLIDERVQLELDDESRWLTVAQLLEFVRQGGAVNIETRTLVACIWASAVSGER
ncbi:MAG: NDP-hexose 2,3-dehydratase family protein, partial [Coriobacteriia bacterium]|nr:NDP-hexose 2,3-dehydratase family protein [Coriobacteriia bacterium]